MLPGLMDYLAQMQDPNQVAQGFGQGGMPVAAGPPRSWWDKAQDKLFPVPEQMRSQGLLTDDDVKNARSHGLLNAGLSLLSNSGPKLAQDRVGLGQALGQAVGAGNQSYQQAVQGAMGMRAGGVEHQMNQMKLKAGKEEMARGDQLRTGRAALMQKLGKPNSADPAAMAKWIDAALPDLIAMGDEETVSRLSEIRKTLGGQHGKGPDVDKVDTGSEIITRHIMPDGSIRVLGRDPKTPSPKDPNDPARAGLEFQRDYTREQGLSDDFNKDTTPYRQSAKKISEALAGADRAAAGDPASQIDMLYAFVNTMDPQSVVREGEIALAQAATPFWSKARAMLDKYSTDRSVSVPPAMVQSMAELMRRRYGGLESAIGERQKYYRNRGKRWGVADDAFAGIDPLAPSTPPVAKETLFPGRP
jgi:hypothetical protein